MKKQYPFFTYIICSSVEANLSSTNRCYCDQCMIEVNLVTPKYKAAIPTPPATAHFI